MASEYRFWRVTNIVPRLLPNSWISLDYIKFNNNKDINMVINNLSVSDTSWSDYADPSYILAQDNSRWTSSNNGNGEVSITYDFKTPVLVETISLRMRQDMASNWGQEWQTAKIFASENGSDWIPIGYIEPRIASMDLSLKTVPIKKLVTADDLNFRIEKKPIFLASYGLTDIDNISAEFLKGLKKQTPIYLVSEDEKRTSLVATVGLILRDTFTDGRVVQLAYIAGRVYEQINGVKIPVVKPVYCYNQRTGALVGKVFSNEKGEYLFTNLNLESLYMIVSVDNNKKYGLEGIAFKKAKEVVVDGLQLSYPITD